MHASVCNVGRASLRPAGRVCQRCLKGAQLLLSKVLIKQALVVNTFASVPSMRLLYLHKPFPSQEFKECACGKCTGSRPWMARSHVLPIPLVSLEMLSGSHKRATLCTSFVSVTIVSHCFTGCSCSTMLCGCGQQVSICVCSNKDWAQLGGHTHFADGSGSCNVVDLCHDVNLWENVSPLRAISHVLSFHCWI